LEAFRVKSEKRIVQAMIEKQKRGEQSGLALSELLASSPCGTAARRSFAPLALHIHAEGEE